MTRANTLTEIWDTYNKNVLSENVPGKPAEKQGTKPGKPPVTANKLKKGFKDEKSTGPSNADGVKEIIDPKKAKKEDELYNSNEYSSEDYNKKDKKIEKKVKESINNFMKSTFDKLFENVMGDGESQELEALGIDVDNDGDVDVEAGEEVTVTLGAEHVKALKEILAQIDGEDEDEGDDEGAEAEDYEEMEEDGLNQFSEDEEDEDEDTVDEAVEAEDLGHAKVNLKRGNELSNVSAGSNVVKGTVSSKAKKGKGGSGKINKQDDSEGTDEGHALVNKKDSGLRNPKNNKVGGLTVGADLFGDN